MPALVAALHVLVPAAVHCWPPVVQQVLVLLHVPPAPAGWPASCHVAVCLHVLLLPAAVAEAVWVVVIVVVVVVLVVVVVDLIGFVGAFVGDMKKHAHAQKQPHT